MHGATIYCIWPPTGRLLDRSHLDALGTTTARSTHLPAGTTGVSRALPVPSYIYIT